MVNTNRCLLLNNRQLSVGQDHFLLPKWEIFAKIEILKLICFSRARGSSFECPIPNCFPLTQIEYWVHFVFRKYHHDSLAIMQPVIKQYNPNILLMVVKFWRKEFIVLFRMFCLPKTSDLFISKAMKMMSLLFSHLFHPIGFWLLSAMKPR